MKSEKFSIFQRSVMKATLACAFVLAVSGLTQAAHAATATGTATASVVAAINIASGSSLRFGAFTVTNAAGEGATINAQTGARTMIGGALSVATGQSPSGAATFNVTGDRTLTYAITLPLTASIMTGVADANSTMVVSALTSFPSGTGALTAGAQTLLVGATLTTKAIQVPGNYTGTFSVSVDYN